MIVDDVWASIGSSNLGFRSMTYDGEINCDAIDGQISRGVRRYARDFRIALWRDHLRLGVAGGGRWCLIRGADSRCCAPQRKAIWRGPTPWRRTIPRS
jgi:phosphatidylserine/phosphatidylglycerophosphate/cardiolipin synthase-like enzyme